jgi:hypothetical protein
MNINIISFVKKSVKKKYNLKQYEGKGRGKRDEEYD